MANPAFRTGAEQAKAASKAGFDRTEYLKLDDGEQVTVRFLTDIGDWITVDQHQMVPTKGKPANYEGDRWPEKMSAVCRYDEAFKDMYSDCYICDFLVERKKKGEKETPGKVRPAASRTWALCCVREEVKEGGKILGYKDALREVTKKDDKGNETTEKVKDIRVVNLAYRNFFGPLTGLAEFYGGTVLDRDFVIKRSGNDQSTNYTLIGLEPIMVKLEGVEEPVKLDLRDERFKDRYAHNETLGDVVGAKASDEYYARFFDPRVTVSKDEKVEQTGQAPDVPKPSTDVDDEAKLAALAQRVQSFGQAEGGGNGGAAAPAAPAAEVETPSPAPVGAVQDFG